MGMGIHVNGNMYNDLFSHTWKQKAAPFSLKRRLCMLIDWKVLSWLPFHFHRDSQVSKNLLVMLQKEWMNKTKIRTHSLGGYRRQANFFLDVLSLLNTWMQRRGKMIVAVWFGVRMQRSKTSPSTLPMNSCSSLKLYGPEFVTVIFVFTFFPVNCLT